MAMARYNALMKRRLQAVQEARRIYIIVLAVRLLLLGLGLIGAMFVQPLALTAVLPLLGMLLVIAFFALLPLPRRIWCWWLALLLALDMLLMSLRVLPVLLATQMASSEWLVEMASVSMIEPFLLMLIPLLLLSWAYGKRGAWLGTLWGSVLQFGGAWLLVMRLDAHISHLPDAAGRTVLMLAISLIVAVLAERQRRQIDDLEEAQTRLRNHADTVEQLAISRERNRIARDLHDTLAHSLAALSVQLQALRGAQDHDPAQARRMTEQAIEVARLGLQESRQAIQALRTDPLTTLGLVGAIRGELRNFEARTGVRTELTILGESIDLSAEQELATWRICEEALRNIERHATASLVTVRVAFGSDQFALMVADDGQGFAPSAGDPEGFGIAGMRERAELAGGHLTIASVPGKGATVRLEIERGDR